MTDATIVYDVTLAVTFAEDSSTASITYELQVEHPCIDATFEAQSLSSMVTSVHAASPATQSVPLLQTRNHYGDINTYDCGVQDHTIFSYDAVNELYYSESFASVSSYVISISSTDLTDEGSYTMAVFVDSINPDYSITLANPLTFTLTIEPCEVTSISVPSVAT